MSVTKDNQIYFEAIEKKLNELYDDVPFKFIKPPWQQKPGEKVGKPGQAWFNQAHQAFYKKTNLVKRLVSLVLPGCSGKAGSKLP